MKRWKRKWNLSIELNEQEKYVNVNGTNNEKSHSQRSLKAQTRDVKTGIYG